ncbi:MAG TPA: hypothetical protein VM287_12350, partial [Egibacteraceae bacterium]|nr:hypothetical protein [Egibacteraceae bacterium]
GALVEIDWVWRHDQRCTIPGPRLLSLPTRVPAPSGVSWLDHAFQVHAARCTHDLRAYALLSPTVAGFPDTCPTCSRPVVPGDALLRHTDLWHHARCLGPHLLTPPRCALCSGTVAVGEGYQRGLALADWCHLRCLSRPIRLPSVQAHWQGQLLL